MTEPKSYEEMTQEEKLAHFDAMVVEYKGRGYSGDELRNALVIGVRHFTLPNNHQLSKEFMRRAAAACGDEVDGRGVWASCQGEVWLSSVLALAEGEG